MDCNFIKKEEKKWVCTKCGYETTLENAGRECKPILQNKEPNILKRILNFGYAFSEHLYKGMPTVDEKKLKERLEICLECPLFKQKQGVVGGVCTHESCGCTIKDEAVFLNKIAWADQKCPIGKWGEVNEKGE